MGFREAGIKLKLKHPIGVLPLFRLQETPSHILKRKAAEMGQKLKRGCFFLNSGINKALAILTSALGADLGQFWAWVIQQQEVTPKAWVVCMFVCMFVEPMRPQHHHHQIPSLLAPFFLFCGGVFHKSASSLPADLLKGLNDGVRYSWGGGRNHHSDPTLTHDHLLHTTLILAGDMEEERLLL